MMDAKKAVHAHEKHMHPGKPMTKLAKGGKTNLQMKQLGRNLAKVANQKNPMRRTRMTGI
jgi:hypothetical protein